MNKEITQEGKDQLNSMEKKLRDGGQKLDSLWMQARTATGQARTEIHKEIGPLRKKQRLDREEHDAMKKDRDIAGRRSNQREVNKGTPTGSGEGDEDVTAGPKE